MATTPPKAGGNILTRKLGPLPGWAWAAIAVGGYFIYKQRKAAAAAAAGSTTSSTAATGTPASGTGQAPSGYGYQGPGVGNGGSGAVPTGAVASTAAAYTPPNQPAGTVGYNATSNTQVITDAQGNQYEYISSPAAAQALVAAGQSIYWQSQPGVFTLAPNGSGPNGAQEFQLVGSSSQ